jgi:hypothetical protein
LWLWVPARAEPVIGPAEGRTHWLGRDDIRNNGALRSAHLPCDKFEPD